MNEYGYFYYHLWVFDILELSLLNEVLCLHLK